MEAATVAIEDLQVLVLSLQGRNLIVPQSMVVEVLPMPDKLESKGQGWLRGFMIWRSQVLPLISVEQLCGADKVEMAERVRRVAIFKGIYGHTKLPHYAVEIHSIPHPLRVTERDMQATKAGHECQYIAQMIKLGNIDGTILDFASLEHKIMGYQSP